MNLLFRNSNPVHHILEAVVERLTAYIDPSLTQEDVHRLTESMLAYLDYQTQQYQPHHFIKYQLDELRNSGSCIVCGLGADSHPEFPAPQKLRGATP